MPSSFFSDRLQLHSQPQQQPNQGPAGFSAPTAEPDPLEDEEDDLGGSDLGGSDDSRDAAAHLEPGAGNGDHDDPPAAAPSSADPLRAERRRSNQLEKELRKARAQLSRFSVPGVNYVGGLNDVCHIVLLLLAELAPPVLEDSGLADIPHPGFPPRNT